MKNIKSKEKTGNRNKNNIDNNNGKIIIIIIIIVYCFRSYDLSITFV